MSSEEERMDWDSDQLLPVGRRADWPLEPGIAFLNHGSFGSCPLPVLAYQKELRDRLERQPVQFLVRDLEPMWDEALSRLAQFLGTDFDQLAFVSCATHGVNAVLRSLKFDARDELLVTNHEYNACHNALDFVAETSGAKVNVAKLRIPVHQPSDWISSILEKVTSRTKLLLIDHVTSPTAVVMPLEEIISEMRSRGILVLVDGAHAPGMIPLNLDQLGADFYTGNCHKWLCSPKGAGFLFVRKDLQDRIRPLAISHGANSTRKDRSRFHLEFGWTGTSDPSACLSVPVVIDWLENQMPGGWPSIMNRNNRLVVKARSFLSKQLGWKLVAPDTMIGSMAALEMPDATEDARPSSPLYSDPFQDTLWEKYQVEVPIVPWSAPRKRLIRISAQLYNQPEDYVRLLHAVKGSLPC
ncbi:aminotransferase class V-fold PLP-dependent enzyme [bacterium]|nr:aminotransferase class V-fold PLP-dependent enzyme [bacterium]